MAAVADKHYVLERFDFQIVVGIELVVDIAAVVAVEYD